MELEISTHKSPMHVGLVDRCSEFLVPWEYKKKGFTMENFSFSYRNGCLSFVFLSKYSLCLIASSDEELTVFRIICTIIG